jgi:hypothetical protein
MIRQVRATLDYNFLMISSNIVKYNAKASMAKHNDCKQIAIQCSNKGK